MLDTLKILFRYLTSLSLFTPVSGDYYIPIYRKKEKEKVRRGRVTLLVCSRPVETLILTVELVLSCHNPSLIGKVCCLLRQGCRCSMSKKKTWAVEEARVGRRGREKKSSLGMCRDDSWLRD